MRTLLRTCVFFVGCALFVVLLAADPGSLLGWLGAGIPVTQARSNGRESSIPSRVPGVEISRARLEKTIQAFAALGSRVPGYPGHRAAYLKTRRTFESLGYHVQVDSFDVAVPIDHGGSLRVVETGATYAVHGFWPNHVQPPTLPDGGVTGQLVYGGRGTLAELDGLRIEDSIVLLDFACSREYLRIRSLGATALLFYDDGHVTRAEAEDKMLNVPADVPRYWIEKDAARTLIESQPVVHLDARMTWEEVTAWNVIARPPAPGEESMLVLSSFYDAISVVPALAPGAENATGLAALFEIARVLGARPTPNEVVFVVNGAHFQALRGVRDFVYRHARGESRAGYAPTQNPIEFDYLLDIDLSSESHQIAAIPHGTFNNFAYTTRLEVVGMLAAMSKLLASYADSVYPGESRLMDAVSLGRRDWKDYMASDLGLDSEVVMQVGRKGIGLVTAWASRRRVDTPVDVPGNVNFEHLRLQTETLAEVVLQASTDRRIGETPDITITDHGRPISGRILRYDREVDFALPRVPVSGALMTYLPKGTEDPRSGVRVLVTDLATSGPTYELTHGSGPGFGSREQVDRVGRFRFDISSNDFFSANTKLRLMAYDLDDRGQIIYAPDFGSESAFPTWENHKSPSNEVTTVLFPARSQTLIETIDPTYLNQLSNTRLLTQGDTPPHEYAYFPITNKEDFGSGESSVTVTFAPWNERKNQAPNLKVLMSSDFFGQKLLLLNTPKELLNRTIDVWEVDEKLEAEARGRGYKTGLVTRPSYKAAQDTWILDEVRLKRLKQYGVSNSRVDHLHEEARGALKAAETHLAVYNYSGFFAETRRAWSLEARAYPEVMGTATDTVRGVIFYFILLLPCSLFFERLLVGATSTKGRLLGFAFFFFAFFLALRFIHPAFKLTNSPYIVFLAFILFALGVGAAIIILSKFGKETLRLRQEETGVIEDDVGRLSVTWTAITLGISNLRKRPLRTALTIITLTLLTFTALSLTSVQTSISYFKLPIDNKPEYNGMLIRDRSWLPLDDPVHDYVDSEFRDRATIAPRAWLTTRVLGKLAFFDFTTFIDRIEADRSSYVHCLLGMSVDEPEITGIDRFLVAGSWFKDNREASCIIPGDLADIIGIDYRHVGRAEIQLMGRRLRVVGIVDSDSLNAFRDLDGERMTPLRMDFERAENATDRMHDPRGEASNEIEHAAHFEVTNTLLLPLDLVKEFGGKIYSVAVGNFRSAKGERVDLRREAESFLKRVSITAFLGDADRVVAYSSMGTIGLSGIGNLFLPILLASLIVLNTMLGAVYERTREIAVYTSVGLAPNHVGALFMAEASVYATVAAVLGYLIGQAAVVALTTTDVGLGGLEVNYSSLAVVWVTLVVMSTTFVSTIYPARQAANLAVPDVTRQWDLPVPEGDHLTFPFPFTVGRDDVLSLTTYLVRVFESYQEGTASAFEVDHVDFREQPHGVDDASYTVGLSVWLPPYDFGISQEVDMYVVPSEDGRHLYSIDVGIRRLSGEHGLWLHANRSFLNAVRKQFLVWRTASNEEKAKYAREGRDMLSSAPA